MEAAQTAFLVTLAIMGGILSPLLLIGFFGMIGSSMNAVTQRLKIAVEEVKKRPPFDEVEVNVNPATNVMTARFLKDGVIIWQGASSRREMEENNILKFDSQDINNG